MANASAVIDQEMIRTLAEASRIDLAPEELARLAAQLTDILEQISPLSDVASSSGFAAHADAPAQPLRADVPGADKLHGPLSRFAPEMREGFFTVPVLPTHRGNA